MIIMKFVFPSQRSRGDIVFFPFVRPSRSVRSPKQF